jgi:DNA/RNA-binding domain of Phe-tRNA-synthetase-like protein
MNMICIGDDFTGVGVHVELGWIRCKVTVEPGSASLRERLRKAADGLGARFSKAADHPAIAATRGAYRKLGKDPSRYRPAAEALFRRVLQNKALPSINNVIDINNLISLETGISIGSYDRDRLTPPLTLDIARSGQTYEGIGRGSLNLEGLAVLADRDGPFGSPTSDSTRSMVDERTTRLLMVFYGLDTTACEPERHATYLVDEARAEEVECGIIRPG